MYKIAVVMALEKIVDTANTYTLHVLQYHTLRGVPTEQRFYSMGPLIGIETNNLKPSHSVN